jgi:hypothetical protein
MPTAWARRPGSVAWVHPARARSLGRGVISPAGCGSILPTRGRRPGLIVLSESSLRTVTYLGGARWPDFAGVVALKLVHLDMRAAAGSRSRRRAEAHPPGPARGDSPDRGVAAGSCRRRRIEARLPRPAHVRPAGARRKDGAGRCACPAAHGIGRMTLERGRFSPTENLWFLHASALAKTSFPVQETISSNFLLFLH